MKTLDYKQYYSQRRKTVDTCESHRQEKTLPEINPESDAIKVCSSICNKPIMNAHYYASENSKRREENSNRN